MKTLTLIMAVALLTACGDEDKSLLTIPGKDKDMGSGKTPGASADLARTPGPMGDSMRGYDPGDEATRDDRGDEATRDYIGVKTSLEIRGTDEGIASPTNPEGRRPGIKTVPLDPEVAEQFHEAARRAREGIERDSIRGE